MQLALVGLALFLFVSTTFGFRRPLSSSVVRRNASSLKMAASFYDIVETGSKGESVPLAQFRGKVVYGVNVASKCGYTASGYALLEKISAMKAQGVEVMILPCNQFGGQEPGSAAEIDSFCALKGVKGANVFAKADVNGAPIVADHLDSDYCSLASSLLPAWHSAPLCCSLRLRLQTYHHRPPPSLLPSLCSHSPPSLPSPSQGPATRPVYKYLKEQGVIGESVAWNFAGA